MIPPRERPPSGGGEIRAGIRRIFALALRRPVRSSADADAELDAMLEEHVAHLVSRGASPDAAREQALRALGSTPDASRTGVRESAEHRERVLARREGLREFLGDARYAARRLRHSPSFAATAIGTFALAIGANTAIFSAVDAVILRPLPFAAPERLVAFYETNPDFGWTRAEAAPANAIDWRERVAAFQDIGSYFDFSGSRTLTGFGEPKLLVSRTITENLFSVLGLRAAIGRTIEPADVNVSGPPRPVVITHRTWRNVFGGDSSVVGRTVEMDGRQVRLVGVLPQSFAIPGFDADIYVQFGQTESVLRSAVSFRRAHYFRAVGRLKPGVTIDEANAQLQVVVKQLQQEYPVTNSKMGAGILPLHEFLVGNTRRPLMVMLAAVGTLLLIACANIANLLLVRAAGMQREAAVRLALGAGRARLARQALTESLVLALSGGVVGIALGWWGTRVLVALQPSGLLRVTNISMNWAVLAYVSAVTVVSALAFGVAPALWTARRAPADALREESRTSSVAASTRRWGEALLVGEVALALMLALGAGLLVRSYNQLRQVHPGFDASGVLTATINPPGSRYGSTPAILSFYNELERRVGTLPGVTRAAVVSQLPLTTPPWSSQFSVVGREPPPSALQVLHREISPNYQDVMRVPLKAGRLLTASDGVDAPMAVLINEALARRHFPNENPVGLRISFDRNPDSNSVFRTIVGVVGDERVGPLAAEAQPEFIAPFPQEPRQGMTLVVRTSGDPAVLAPLVRREVAALDPALAIVSMRTMDEVLAAALARDRFLTALMLAFAGVGVALGIVGVYGVVAQLARRRHREMGIRIALGAGSEQVQWLVVRHGLALTLAGVVVGTGGALAFTGALRTLLYQVAPTDPATFVAVPLLVVASALAASWVPALRASRTPPAEVLRAD